MDKPQGKAVNIKCNEDELALLVWLKEKTSRTASGVFKFAAKELAQALGYKPAKRGKHVAKP